MRSPRKLRVVPDCPQAQAEPIQELVTGDGKHLIFGHDGYGCKPIPNLPHSPPAHEISIRARAQSILSRDGRRAELPDYETALKIIAESNRPKRDWNVTVPKPRKVTP